MFNKIIICIIIYLCCLNCFATIPDKEIVKFKKLPEGSQVLIVVYSIEFDTTKVLYGEIKKDILDNNYIKCFDFDRDCWRLIYPNEKELIEYFVQGCDG
jgi:hypothetical protein